MRNRTRVIIKNDGSSGAPLINSNKAIQFTILPDISAQIQAGKKYLIYLTKLYQYGIPVEDQQDPHPGLSDGENTTAAVIINGLSVENNNLNLQNIQIEKMPVIGIFNLTKPKAIDYLSQAIFENPHPKDDALVCSNPFNTQLNLQIYNLKTNAFVDLSTTKNIIEFMVEEICDC